MSRTSITWGIPLPWDAAHVTYVWFDALFNYCTAVGYGSDRERFDRYWPVDYHLVGKDILRFHAVFWPAMLMAAGEAPPKCVFAHGYLLVGGEKMSKTRLNQIAPADLVADFGSDGFRYHFLTDQRFGPDGDFSYEAMVARYNADLANNFGNLANRVLNMAVNYCGGVVPDTRAEGPLAGEAARVFAACTTAFAAVDYSAAFAAVWELIRATNSYIEDQEPWKLHKAGEAAAVAAVLGDCLEALRVVALLASPVIPRASAELWRRLGLPGTPEDQRLPEAAAWGQLPPGAPLEKGDPLFPRFEA
jgi:methionyl-tRNA synthetase